MFLIKYYDLINVLYEADLERWHYDIPLDIYIYIEDVRITIQKDYSYEEEYDYDWAKKFIGTGPRPERYYVRFNGVNIYQYNCVVLDSGKIILPIPHTEGMTINNLNYCIGKIVNIQHGEIEYDRYLKKARISIKD